MADAPAPRKPVVTTRQVLLIAVLGVILAVVLIVQFGGASDGPADNKGKPRSPAVASTPSKPSAPSTATGPKAAGIPATAAKAGAAPVRPPKAAWTKLSGQAAGQYDPFAMPEPLAREVSAPSAAKSKEGKGAAVPRNPASDPALATLRRKGTDAVLRDAQGALAVIDNRVVRVGDVIHGYRVVSIDDDGVLVAPPNPQDVPEDRK